MSLNPFVCSPSATSGADAVRSSSASSLQRKKKNKHFFLLLELQQRQIRRNSAVRKTWMTDGRFWNMNGNSILRHWMAAEHQKLRRASTHVYFFLRMTKGLITFPHNLFVTPFYSQSFDDVSALYDLELRGQRNVANAQWILQQDANAAVLYMNLGCPALLRGHPVMLVLKLPLMEPSILFPSPPTSEPSHL